MWTIIEIAQLIIIPLALAMLGYFLDRRLRQIDQQNKKHRQQELEAKEKERDELERKYKLRIEFTINAISHGTQNGSNLVEFITTINNKSAIQHKFTAINLRVRGIKKEQNIGLWKPTIRNKQIETKKINFPEKLMDENIIPPQWNYIFVEPGVKQELIYTTRIPEDISFILATVEFHYDTTTPHTAEHMFAVKVNLHTGENHE